MTCSRQTHPLLVRHSLTCVYLKMPTADIAKPTHFGMLTTMSDYRRAFVPGATFFFTVVTDGRVPLFSNDSARAILGNVIRHCQRQFPMEIVAIVLLPEHLHALWTLPPRDSGYSKRWGWIKKEFTKAWLAAGGQERPLSMAQQREGRHAIWQRRFWEHMIRDEDDLAAHFDYIHYNPVNMVESHRRVIGHGQPFTDGFAPDTIHPVGRPPKQGTRCPATLANRS